MKNILRPLNFKVCIKRKYSKPKLLDFSVPQGYCFGANIFTCYCILIENIIPHDITANSFASDHSLRKTYKVTDKEHGIQSKSNLQSTFMNIQKWMDTMQLKLNSDKTKYIQFASTKHIKKLDTSLFNANGDLIEPSTDVRYLGGYLDSSLTFKGHVKEKTRRAVANIIKKINTKISHSGCSHNSTSYAIHFSPGLCKCNALQDTRKNIMQVPNCSKHLCEDSTKQIQVFQLH